MKHTETLGLKKPDSDDYINIQDFNENADVIDEAVKNTNNRIDTLSGETDKSVSDIEQGLQNHVDDNARHITETERNNWNNKQEALPEERTRKIEFGTEEPTGGEHGDIYFQYEE